MCSQTSHPKTNQEEESDISMQQPFSPQTLPPQEIVSTYTQNFRTNKKVISQSKKRSSTKIQLLSHTHILPKKNTSPIHYIPLPHRLPSYPPPHHPPLLSFPPLPSPTPRAPKKKLLLVETTRTNRPAKITSCTQTPLPVHTTRKILHMNLTLLSRTHTSTHQMNKSQYNTIINTIHTYSTSLIYIP